MPLRGCMCHTSASSRKQKQKARKGFAIVLALALLAKCACRRGIFVSYIASLLLFSPQCEKGRCFTLGCFGVGKPKTQGSLSVKQRKPKSSAFPSYGAYQLAVLEIALGIIPPSGAFEIARRKAPDGVGVL